MPALFAPAIDLAAISAVIVALALVFLAYKISQAIAGGINVSILGAHPFAGVSHRIENSIVSWLGSAVNELQKALSWLWQGLVWSWGEFLDGVNAMTTHTEQALSLLWGTSIPAYVKTAIRPLAQAATRLDARLDAIERDIPKDLDKLDGKIDTAVRAAVKTLDRDIDATVGKAVHGIDAEIRAIRSSVDQAVDHAIALARAESQTALTQLRRAEDAALDALSGTVDAGFDDLREQLGQLDPTQIASLVAAVPALAALVNVLAEESGLSRAECRQKVRGICATDPSDWATMLLGIGAVGFALNIEEVITAGREVFGALMDNDLTDAILG